MRRHTASSDGVSIGWPTRERKPSAAGLLMVIRWQQETPGLKVERFQAEPAGARSTPLKWLRIDRVVRLLAAARTDLGSGGHRSTDA
jgi:hypothetical protein